MILRHSSRAAGVRPRRGFALMLAVGSLTIIAILIAGSTYIVLQEDRLGQDQVAQTRAFTVAEYGLNKIQADWDMTPNLQMDVGASYDTNYVLPRGSCHVRYTRLNNETFWIVADGQASAGALSKARTAQKRLNAVLRLRIPTIRTQAAITINGSAYTSGNAHIYGQNVAPTNWTGCTPAPDLAGVMIPQNGNVIRTGSDDIQGNPAVKKTTLASDSATYVSYGDETWKTLAAMAIDVTNQGPQDIYPDTNALGTCNKARAGNWGEPWRGGQGYTPACRNYFPILISHGSLDLRGNGRGQGILLVEGDLTVDGTFDFYGIVIVRDDIQRGTGNSSIHGSVMARNENPQDKGDVGGNTMYQYSSCAVDRALRGSAQVVQAKQRAWAELF